LFDANLCLNNHDSPVKVNYDDDDDDDDVDGMDDDVGLRMLAGKDRNHLTVGNAIRIEDPATGEIDGSFDGPQMYCK
jgi:hypothetical protein